MFKVVTINILFDLETWDARRHLLVEGLAAEQADIIGIQEVRLPEDTSAWLAEQLQMPDVHLVPYHKPKGLKIPNYGAAILSRHPFIRSETLDLQTQGRFAQRVQIEVNHQPIVFCNGHYFWHPGPSPERVKQIQLLLDWLGELPPQMPVVAVGDFNGTPETPAISLMREKFASAYAVRHGCEPEYTCPTPLARRGAKRILRQTLLNLKANRTLQPWRGTLDYIFIDRHFGVRDCQLILVQPDRSDRTLYPSDHFGIAAELEQLTTQNSSSPCSIESRKLPPI